MSTLSLDLLIKSIKKKKNLLFRISFFSFISVICFYSLFKVHYSFNVDNVITTASFFVIIIFILRFIGVFFFKNYLFGRSNFRWRKNLIIILAVFTVLIVSQLIKLNCCFFLLFFAVNSWFNLQVDEYGVEDFLFQNLLLHVFLLHFIRDYAITFLNSEYVIASFVNTTGILLSCGAFEKINSTLWKGGFGLRCSLKLPNFIKPGFYFLSVKLDPYLRIISYTIIAGQIAFMPSILNVYFFKSMVWFLVFFGSTLFIITSFAHIGLICIFYSFLLLKIQPEWHDENLVYFDSGRYVFFLFNIAIVGWVLFYDYVFSGFQVALRRFFSVFNGYCIPLRMFSTPAIKYSCACSLIVDDKLVNCGYYDLKGAVTLNWHLLLPPSFQLQQEGLLLRTYLRKPLYKNVCPEERIKDFIMDYTSKFRSKTKSHVIVCIKPFHVEMTHAEYLTSDWIKLCSVDCIDKSEFNNFNWISRLD